MEDGAVLQAVVAAYKTVREASWPMLQPAMAARAAHWSSETQATTGITWVRVGKAPMRDASGEIIGIFGMYELLDAEKGRRLFAERNIKRRKT